MKFPFQCDEVGNKKKKKSKIFSDCEGETHEINKVK